MKVQKDIVTLYTEHADLLKKLTFEIVEFLDTMKADIIILHFNLSF